LLFTNLHLSDSFSFYIYYCYCCYYFDITLLIPQLSIRIRGEQNHWSKILYALPSPKHVQKASSFQGNRIVDWKYCSLLPAFPGLYLSPRDDVFQDILELIFLTGHQFLCLETKRENEIKPHRLIQKGLKLQWTNLPKLFVGLTLFRYPLSNSFHQMRLPSDQLISQMMKLVHQMLKIFLYWLIFRILF
jgi:hypothetical protein